MTRRVALAIVFLLLLVGASIDHAGAQAVLGFQRTTAPSSDLVAGQDAAWRGARETVIALNRTPPLFVGDPMDDGERPAATVAVLCNDEGTFLRIRWSDPSESFPLAPERVADGGDPSIYVAHSLDIDRFADAACVMVPQKSEETASFPSLMMGDEAHPVDLYYWNAARGFERLVAAGRGTTTRSGETIPGSVHRTAQGWDCIFQIPRAHAGTPISFAIWDGEREHRDGLKFYSIWYEMAEGGTP